MSLIPPLQVLAVRKDQNLYSLRCIWGYNNYILLSKIGCILIYSNQELSFSPQQTIELVRKYDTDNDNKLSYEEFVQFYTKVKTK